MQGLHHIGIISLDVEKAEKFYYKYFGFTKGYEFDVPASTMQTFFNVNCPAHVVALNSGNLIVELFSLSDKVQFRPKMGSITHFAVYVENRKDKADELKADGYEVLSIVKEDKNIVYFIKDPDNNLVELKD